MRKQNCHSREGGNPGFSSISDPRFHGDDSHALTQWVNAIFLLLPLSGKAKKVFYTFQLLFLGLFKYLILIMAFFYQHCSSCH